MSENNRDVALSLVKQFRYGNNLAMVDRIAAALDAAYARGQNEAREAIGERILGLEQANREAHQALAKSKTRIAALIDKIAADHDQAMIASGTLPALGQWVADDAGWKRCAPNGEVGVAVSPLPDGRWKWFVWERGGPKIADGLVATEQQAKASADACVPAAGWARLTDAVKVLDAGTGKDDR